MEYDEETLLRLVEIASARWQAHPEIDEIRQVAAEVALKSIKRCELNGKRPSRRYLLLTMRSRIARWQKRRTNARCDALNDNDAPAEDTSHERVEAIDFAKHAQQVLAPDEQELLRMRFWESKSFVEIGEALGISKSGAEVRLKNVLKRLRESADDLPTQGRIKGRASAVVRTKRGE